MLQGFARSPPNGVLRVVHGPFPYDGTWKGQDVIWTDRTNTSMGGIAGPGGGDPSIQLVTWNKKPTIKAGVIYGVHNNQYASGSDERSTQNPNGLVKLGGFEDVPIGDPANDGDDVPHWPGNYWQGATVCTPGDLSGADVGGGYPRFGTTVGSHCNGFQIGDTQKALAPWADVVKRIPAGRKYSFAWYLFHNFGNSVIMFTEPITMPHPGLVGLGFLPLPRILGSGRS